MCPSTDSTFDLRSGAVKEWYPKNPVLRALTPALRTLYVYPSKTDEKNIYISLEPGSVNADAAAEIVFSGKAQPGVTVSDVNVDEVTQQTSIVYFLRLIRLPNMLMSTLLRHSEYTNVSISIQTFRSSSNLS